MGDKKIYIVAKIFDQQGCIAYRCKTLNEARCVPGTLEALRAGRTRVQKSLRRLKETAIKIAFIFENFMLYCK